MGLIGGLIFGCALMTYMIYEYNDRLVGCIVGIAVCAAAVGFHFQKQHYTHLREAFEQQSELLDRSNDTNLQLLSKLTDKTVLELWEIGDRMEEDEPR